MEFFHKVISFLMWYFRPAIKWFLRKTTRLCELQRLCYGETPGGPRTIGVENALLLSRSLMIHTAIQELDSLIENDCDEKQLGAGISNFENKILDVKQIKRQLHMQFINAIRNCLIQIWSYRRLKRSVEILRITPYDDTNTVHEEMLMELWNRLQPNNPLPSRKTKMWQTIGFQGEDPKTDFRGMGILGLANLVYFVKEYEKAAKHVLSHSHHPQHGYSFAIVGINITSMAYRLLRDGVARSHMHNIAPNGCTMENFHHFYSYLFIEFDKLWMKEKPENVMEFNRIRDLFESVIKSMLSDSKMCLKINLVVDVV